MITRGASRRTLQRRRSRGPRPRSAPAGALNARLSQRLEICQDVMHVLPYPGGFAPPDPPSPSLAGTPARSAPAGALNARLSQRLEICQDVMHVLVGVFPELIEVRVERVVDREADASGRPRAIPALRVAEANREFVAVGECSRDGLTRCERDGDLHGRGRRRAAASTADRRIQHALQELQALVTCGE